MKKIIAILVMAALMVFMFAACGAAKTEPEAAKDDGKTEETANVEKADEGKTTDITNVEKADDNKNADVTKAEKADDSNVNKSAAPVESKEGSDGEAKDTNAPAPNKAAQLVKKTSASIAFVNSSGIDFAELYFASSASDKWGDEWLGSCAPLEDGYTVTNRGRLNYADNDTLWDLLIIDMEGYKLQFDCIDLSLADNPEEIYIELTYNADRDTFSATIY